TLGYLCLLFSYTMRFILVFIFGLFSIGLSAQSDALAKDFFEKGQFDKAVIAYEELYKTNPNSSLFFGNLLTSYQELKQFDKAEKLILERQKRAKQANLFVELGYNHQLQDNTQKAEEYYTEAFKAVQENINQASIVAYAFEQKNLLEKALEVYNYASSQNDKLNFEFQKARIYGQLGNLEMMIESYLEYAYKNKNYTPSVQNQFNRFIIEDSSDSFTEILRKALLTKAQKTQDIYWNEFLSWFFIQQKQYDRAFAQEKAIFRRSPESFSNIISLSQIAIEEEEYPLAQEIFAFILENTQDLETHLFVKTSLMEIKIQTADSKEYSKIKIELEGLINE